MDFKQVMNGAMLSGLTSNVYLPLVDLNESTLITTLGTSHIMPYSGTVDRVRVFFTGSISGTTSASISIHRNFSSTAVETGATIPIASGQSYQWDFSTNVFVPGDLLSVRLNPVNGSPQNAIFSVVVDYTNA